MKNDLRVLWFCNTAANGDEVLATNNSGSGTWLRTLDLAIQSKVELHIAFYHTSNVEFTVGQTRYYGIRRYKNTFDRVVSKIAERFFDYVRDDTNSESYLNIVSKVKPDLIHIHGTENSFGCIISSVSVPVIVSIQGLLSEVYSFYSKGLGDNLMAIRDFDFRSLKNAIFPTTFLNSKNKFERMANIERKNLKSTKFVIGRTFWDKRITGLLAPERTYFHNDEIMRDEFAKANWVPSTKLPKFIRLHTTSDNVYYKGLETVCDSILNLKDSGYNCRWNVAGVNSDDLIVKVLKKKYGPLFPEDEIQFLGRIPARDLICSMNESDIFVMPSHIENSPNSLCEAMLLGMPCIATNAGGTADFVNGNNCVLIQPGDGYSLAAVIIDLHMNTSLALTMAAHARNVALSRHDPDIIVNKLLDIYDCVSS